MLRSKSGLPCHDSEVHFLNDFVWQFPSEVFDTQSCFYSLRSPPLCNHKPSLDFLKLLLILLPDTAAALTCFANIMTLMHQVHTSCCFKNLASNLNTKL